MLEHNPRRNGIGHTEQFVGLEPLEARTLLSITPGTAFDGMNFNSTSAGAVPPDTHAAVGPNNVVETVNTAVRVFDKAGTVLSTRELSSFFGVSEDYPNQFISDPRVVYDESTGHFIMEALYIDNANESSFVLLATSNTSNPTGGWEKHIIDVTETENGQRLWGDFPGLGWDADGIYITLNMFDFSAVGGFHHASLITINKKAAEDGNASTFTSYHVQFSSDDFTVQPATMHGSKSRGPLYMIEESPSEDGQHLEVLKIAANKLSSHPTILRYEITVPFYTPGIQTPAPQLGGFPMDTGDSRILDASWRGGTLVAAQNAGDPITGVTHARWYAISTTTGVPMYSQSGDIDPGPGVFTYYPSVEINPAGSIGMTYMQSSATQYVSMYITGRAASDPSGVMQAPVLAKGGETTYMSFDAPLYRAGDFSGVSVDPLNGSFWAANEYATSKILFDGLNANWGTWIAKFTVAAGGPYLAMSPTSGGIVIGGGSSTIPLATTGELQDLLASRAASRFHDVTDLLDEIGRRRRGT